MAATEFGNGSLEEPINHEYAGRDLVSSFLTPAHLSYHRNHGPIPIPPTDPSAHTHTLTITSDSGLLTQSHTLTATQLATSFAQHTVTCALQCAGNRRHTMRTRLKEVQGIDWFDGAVMNCEWEGPLLRDVLVWAGVGGWRTQGAKGDGDGDADDRPYEGLHVQFACHLVATQDDGYYGGSIGLGRAMDPEMEVILALKCNTLPLTLAHGSPIRALVPGHPGARSVKWLTHLTISPHESPCHYQQRDYKVLPPEAVDSESAEPYWAKTAPMADLGLNSGVGVPEEGGTVELDGRGGVEVRGWAVPSGDGRGGRVVRVQVSGDEGRSWSEAELQGSEGGADDGGDRDKGRGRWSWVLWRCWVKVEKGEGRTILCRAFDRAGNAQPRFSQWNLRGVGYNGYGEVGGLRVE